MLTPRDPENRNMQGAPTSQPDFSASAYAVVPPSGITGGGRDGGDGRGEACTLVAVNLSAYLDDELDPDQQRLVEAHLMNCPKCAADLAALQTTDTIIEREWREEAPLPSSLELQVALDNIMDALPPVPAPTDKFATKRVHARARWMRFSTGTIGLFLFGSLLWSSYRLGYSHGRMSVSPGHISVPAASPEILPASDPSLVTAAFTVSSANKRSPSFYLPPPPLQRTNSSLLPSSTR